MKLSAKDIKTIKYEKRMGYIYSGFLLSGCALFNLFYMVAVDNKVWEVNILVNIIFISLSILVPYWMNRKHNQDLKMGVKIVKLEKVQQKENETSYEAGSGTLYIGQEMNRTSKLNLIINGYRYEVEKEVFDKAEVGELIEMHYTFYGNNLLGIEAIKRS